MIDTSSEQNHLTRRAARLLQAGQPLRAFRLADRLCRRFRRPDPRHFLLRATTARMLGDVGGAAADLQIAFDQAPSDPAVAEAIMHDPGAPASLRLLAARTIVQASSATVDGTRSALSMLLEPENSVAARARLIDGALVGWIGWRGPTAVMVHVRGSDGVERIIVLQATAGHPLATPPLHVAPLHVAVGGNILPDVSCTFEDGTLPATSVLALSHDASRRSAVQPVQGIASTTRRGCTVIVPCYDDAEFTTQCLASLARQVTTAPLAVVLVNDRPDDRRLGAILEEFASLNTWSLVSTPHNLGFVGAVETGLAVCDADCDVLLLNADTLLPFGALERLAVAAYRSPDIGTVTPLSNNGELTSLPQAFAANPLPDRHAVEVLDAIASLKNRDVAPDLPSGVGFCLYVKRTCLDAVGGLPNAYHRGYYEDAELCLRARRRGYRNICAADVYVGHAGSRSFKGEKRILVARNLRLLRSRFPRFTDDSLAFRKRDGLEAARQVVAVAAAKPAALSKLLVARENGAFAAQARAAQLRAGGIAVLFLTRLDAPLGTRVQLLGFDEEEPLRCAFDIAHPESRAALFQLVERLGVRSAEILDDPGLPDPFLVELGHRVSLRALIDRDPFPAASTIEPAVRPVSPALRLLSRPDQALADRPLAMNAMAAAVLHARGIPFVAKRAPSRRAQIDVEPDDGAALGILYPEASAAGERLLRMIVSQLGGTTLVVLGETFADEAYMSHADVVVTGAVGPDEIDTVIERQRVGALFFLDRCGGTALLEALGARLGLPIAAFDWSSGAAPFAPIDLGIDPRLCDSEVAGLLLPWAERRLRSRVDDN